MLDPDSAPKKNPNPIPKVLLRAKREAMMQTPEGEKAWDKSWGNRGPWSKQWKNKK